jgi:hypothetical protein
MIYALALLVSLAVVASLGVMLYVWFQLSLMRFHTAVARDVLTDWDAQLAELPEFARAQQRAQPPVEVLEAILDLPSRRSPRYQSS